MSSLTKQQTTFIYIAGAVLSLGLAGSMLSSLNASRAYVNTQTQEVERKENQLRMAKQPAREEQNKWAEEEARISNLLLSEQVLPQFFEELTDIAKESGIQRLGMNTEEVTIDPSKPSSPAEATIVAMGIRRYLTVTMKFQGQYSDIGRFLGGVAKLDRPVEYRLVELKRNVPLIEVQIAMNVYKRGLS